MSGNAEKSTAPAAPRRISSLVFTLAALAVALLLALIVSTWASSNPDGLEYVAQTTGFAGSAADSAAAVSPLADYSFAGLDPWLSVALVGLVGCAVTFGLAWLVARLARRAG